MATIPISPAPNDALLALLQGRGYSRVDTPVLQPAELFLDLSGEDIRRRLFLTTDRDGRELCLRPEYTIPVCRAHLQAKAAVADYCYLGPVFRHRPGESGEFLQAGIESIGRTDLAAADADVLELALSGVTCVAPGATEVRIGDMGLLAAVMRALDVRSSHSRRLLRDIAAGRPARDLLAPEPRAPGSDHAGLLAAIEGQDPRAARAFIEDVLSIAGISNVGGRSAGEIADRFLSRAENRSGTLSDRARDGIGRFLEIKGSLQEVPAGLRRLAQDCDMAIGGAIDAFDRRVDAMVARGLPVAGFAFAADFARMLDYYTGFIFEIRNAARPEGDPVAAGGRYDRLLQHLGAEQPVPAVGCAFWLDRLGKVSQ